MAATDDIVERSPDRILFAPKAEHAEECYIA
jgi:hypothetical protein